jgi:hypothetical protein
MIAGLEHQPYPTVPGSAGSLDHKAGEFARD